MDDCFPEVITEHGCRKMVCNVKNRDGAASRVIPQVVGGACMKKGGFKQTWGKYHTQK